MASSDPLPPDDASTCASLLAELQHIWDEIGESDSERDAMLLQLEQECLDVYRKKVELASLSRAHLHQSIADAETKIAHLTSLIGDHTLGKRERRGNYTLKEQLLSIHPLLEQLLKKKEERLREFADIKRQIQSILIEISGSPDLVQTGLFSNTEEEEEEEPDLSLGRLEEYHTHLRALQKEKAERVDRVIGYINDIHDLSSVLCIDPGHIHPSLANSSDVPSKSISDDTLDGLKMALQDLQVERKTRMKKFQELGTSLVELWNLMDSPQEVRCRYRHVTNMIAAKENDITSPGVLSLDRMHEAEEEIRRLETLKVSQMKELIMRKRSELDEIYVEAHLEPDPDASYEATMAIIESGQFDAAMILADMDEKIAVAKQSASKRKDILDKVEKWALACEEETWLEDYNRDENRYSASRGAHINLKRAEKARIMIQKLPGLVESLVAKIAMWEDDHGMPFLYDGMRLMEVLGEHNQVREEKEQERKRQRDQRKLQEQLVTEQEALFGSRPSPHKSFIAAKKGLSVIRSNGNTPNRRLSLGGIMLQNGNGNGETQRKANGITLARSGRDNKVRPSAPVNYVAFSKDDTATASA